MQPSLQVPRLGEIVLSLCEQIVDVPVPRFVGNLRASDVLNGLSFKSEILSRFEQILVCGMEVG